MEFKDVNIDLNAIERYTLDYFQRNARPVSLNEIYQYVRRRAILATKENVEDAIAKLIVKGYDIKTIVNGDERLYSLIRFASYNEEELFRIHGDIETPAILASDFHFGSFGYSDLAFNVLKQDVLDYRIKDMVLAGDILQGRGVHRIELNDLQLPRLGDQIELATRKLGELNCNLHAVIGNHEEKIKGNIEVGLDPISILASKLDNMTYYGSVAQLMVDGNYHLMMMHGGGGVTKAVTYRLENIWRELLTKPNIFVLGHIHQSGYARKSPESIGFQVGALQRSNSWLMSKGYNSKVGWWIIEEIPDMSKIKMIERCPLVY